MAEVESENIRDDLSRDVYCVLGIPLDSIGMESCLRRLEAAATNKVPFLISTPNLNFLVNSQASLDFRESLLLSDLCSADGISIVWIARLVGVPIRNRIAGSDIFDALLNAHSPTRPLKVFLFGGIEGAAAAACRKLNVAGRGLYCVGWLYPGFGSVDEMSRQETIDRVNSSNADILVAALGAMKGQLWLQRNHHRLLIPVRAHLGAVINFQAGLVRRAPPILRKLGLEWLWRIKEEPYLWKRYWKDGRLLPRLFLTRIFPLAVCLWWQRFMHQSNGQRLVVSQLHDDRFITLSLSGCATANYVEQIVSPLTDALTAKKGIVIDLTNACAVDARFLGLLLMVRKVLRGRGMSPIYKGVSPRLKRMFWLHGAEFLLGSDRAV